MSSSDLDVGPLDVSGTWYRHIPAFTPAVDPLWLPPDRTGEARWQKNSVVFGLYVADSQETMWAEWYRSLAEAGLEPTEAVPREVWGFEVELTVANLSTPKRLRRVRLPYPLSPDRNQWPRCQEIGHSLCRAGYAGLKAVSAARPTGRTLCLFRVTGDVPGLVQHTRLEVVDVPPAPPRGLRT